MLTHVTPFASLPAKRPTSCACFHTCTILAQQRPHSSRLQQPQQHTVHRRSMLTGLVAGGILFGRQKAYADELSSIPLPLPGQPLVDTGLPKEYVDVTSKLIDTLTEAIAIDIGGGEEKEVRKAADPAKDLVKQWLTKWKDAPDVQGNDSHTQMKATIQELGEFYRKNGQRTRLSQEVGEQLLDRLGVAAAALPEKDTRNLLEKLVGVSKQS